MSDVRTAAEALLYVLDGDHSQGEYQAAVDALKAAVTAEAPSDPAPAPEPAPAEAPPAAPVKTAPAPVEEPVEAAPAPEPSVDATTTDGAATNG